MLLEKGCVVKSISGRDAGRFYAVLGLEHDAVWIADGKVRRVEKPKRKNGRHLRATKTRLSQEALTTNNQLRRALRAFNDPDPAGQLPEGGNALV